MPPLLRRAAIAGLVALAAMLHDRAMATETLRIGYQKSSTLMIFLKGQGTLEKELAPLGVSVEWHEFSSGLPLLEGVNVGSIDLSADVADTVPLFAQAAGASITYVAEETPSPSAQAIVVGKDSPIRNVSDLKGKKIGLAKAAGVHYLALRVLAKAGLSLNDVEIADLQPADGRAAFEKGAIDAWAIWDPFLSAVQNKSKARVLIDGTAADVSYRRFYLAATPYVQRRPDVLAKVVDALRKTGQWVKAEPKEAARRHAALIQLDAETLEQANSRRTYAVTLVDAAALDEQQKIADAFAETGLLPKKIDVRQAAVWKGPR